MSSSTITRENVSENSTLCSIDQCVALFDVRCFHCHSNMCSNHYFEHKQQQLITTQDDAMDDLLKLASSKCFSITTGKTAISKHRRKFSNPFVSSAYLLKKMKQQAARRRNDIKPSVTTKTIAITTYNSRKRHEKRITTTITTTTMMDVCKTVLKSKLGNKKFCNRKLPCPYHTTE